MSHAREISMEEGIVPAPVSDVNLQKLTHSLTVSAVSTTQT
jgi:hypothetical protein